MNTPSPSTRTRASGSPAGAPGPPPAVGTAGFSLVEVVVAMLILTVGLLGMAGGTAYVIRTTTLAEMETHRAAALQAGVEDVRAIPFEVVSGGERIMDPFTIRWEADPAGATNARTKVITIFVEGPGRIPGTGPMPSLAPSVVDTFTYRLIRREP